MEYWSRQVVLHFTRFAVFGFEFIALDGAVSDTDCGISDISKVIISLFRVIPLKNCVPLSFIMQPEHVYFYT